MKFVSNQFSSNECSSYTWSPTTCNKRIEPAHRFHWELQHIKFSQDDMRIEYDPHNPRRIPSFVNV